MTILTGTTLAGRYVVDRQLGAGGMAVVYLAHDRQHDRRVALKVLRPELAAVIGADRFLAEIRTTANLQHPHILALYDSGQADGLVYYVMPFVEGESLRDRLDRETQLPVDQAVRIARDVAAALDSAHRRGVIHRDIKPENILLHESQAVVADFGIALAASRTSDTRMTETGMSLGTPTYMSPEQAMGERTLDARTDVYALGCVLFEMLAGEPPFTGPTAQAIVAKVLTEEPRSLTGLRRSVPPNVDAAVRGALEKLPADRIGSAREFADALAGPGPAARITASDERQRSVARHPLVLSLAAAVALLAGALGWQATDRPAAPRPQVSRFAIDLPAETRLAVFSLVGANIAISPDGRIIVFAAEGPDGTRRLYQRALDEIEARVLSGTEGASQPSFSHDGRWIAYLADGRLMRMSLDGSARQPIVAVSDVAGHAWTRSGSIVFKHLPTGGLATVPATGGTPTPVTRLDSANGEMIQQQPVALPDGDHVLYSSWGSGGTESIRIGVASLKTGRSVRLDLAGATPLGMAGNHLVYATTNFDILAAPVDLSAGRVLGDPIPVVSGVMIGTAGVAKAVLSSTGTLVYLGGAQSAQMVLVGLNGGMEERVMPDARAYGYPRYSPDGRSIAMTIAAGPTGDVWIYDLASRTNTRLTSGGANNERPEWTADGRHVLYRSDRAARSSIWWRRADHGDPEAPLLGDGSVPYFEAVMTPDGSALVYQVDSSGADVEYRRLTGDTVPRPIAASAAIENSARISPDGRWVAYVTDATGSRQVVVQPLPGPGPRIQVSTDAGAEPVWSRDGRRLFYRGTRRFMAVDFVTTPSFAVTARHEFFDDIYQPAISPHANYDVTPDGKKLLVLKGAEVQQLMVVQNWAEELRARIAGSAARP